MKKITIRHRLTALAAVIFAAGFFAAGMFTTEASAQTIGTKELQEIQGSFKNDSYTSAVQNVVSNNKSIKSMVLNSRLNGTNDNFFKYKVDVKGITDQQNSGRCWMFASMNDLRPRVMKKFNVSSFDFSHVYNQFWDLLEKSNLYLEDIIKTLDQPVDSRAVAHYFSSPIGDGGVWNLFWNLADKYGVVPKEVMPETAQSNSTGQMVSLINERLRKGGYELRKIAGSQDNNAGTEGAAKYCNSMRNKATKTSKQITNSAKSAEIESAKLAVLKDVYRILAICLGEPPTEFTWRYEDKDGKVNAVKTTPKEFFKSIIPSDYSPDNYIMVMNDPTREYYKIYEIDDYRNTYEGINWTYLNLPNEDIKKAALAQIKANEPLYASCDVGKQSNTAAGSGQMDINLYDYNTLLGVDFSMDKRTRILTRQSGSSHAMLVVACDTDDNDVPVKWEFENSWGADAGNKGYLTFSDKWFDEYMFRMVINKKYLTGKALESTSQKSIMLPAWDYMF